MTEVTITRDNAATCVEGPKAVLDVLRSALRIGARYPAHATAAGKALLAAQWGARLAGSLGPGPYAALTPHTVSGPAELTRALAAVRAAGIAVEREEHSLDIRGLACPVRNVLGEVIAAIGVQGPAPSFARNETAWTRLVKDASRDLSQRLGWRDETAPGQDRSGSPLID
jgi:DNA-binding IclR family transcriptional regulator